MFSDYEVEVILRTRNEYFSFHAFLSVVVAGVVSEQSLWAVNDGAVVGNGPAPVSSAATLDRAGLSAGSGDTRGLALWGPPMTLCVSSSGPRTRSTRTASFPPGPGLQSS